MMSARDQSGFTLIELVVGMALSLVVIGAAMSLLIAVLNDNRSFAFRDDAQADSQIMVERLSRELRSAASPSAGAAGLLEKATSYDLVFQTVSADAGQTAPAGNPTNQMRVRYCLDGNQTLWRQSETPSSLASNPLVPTGTACPSTDSQWLTSTGGAPCCVALQNVANPTGSQSIHPLFSYGPSTGSQIKQVQVDLYVNRNPGHLPGPAQLTSGIYLRNGLAPPVADFIPTLITTTHSVQLNGSPASDPQGQALSYQWYLGQGCLASGAISGATATQYTAGPFTPGTSQYFSLQVTNTGGLTGCTSQSVAIQ